jgi:hypothetical protein
MEGWEFGCVWQACRHYMCGKSIPSILEVSHPLPYSLPITSLSGLYSPKSHRPTPITYNPLSNVIEIPRQIATPRAFPQDALLPPAERPHRIHVMAEPPHRAVPEPADVPATLQIRLRQILLLLGPVEPPHLLLLLRLSLLLTVPAQRHLREHTVHGARPVWALCDVLCVFDEAGGGGGEYAGAQGAQGHAGDVLDGAVCADGQDRAQVISLGNLVIRIVR